MENPFFPLQGRYKCPWVSNFRISLCSLSLTKELNKAEIDRGAETSSCKPANVAVLIPAPAEKEGAFFCLTCGCASPDTSGPKVWLVHISVISRVVSLWGLWSWLAGSLANSRVYKGCRHRTTCRHSDLWAQIMCSNSDSFISKCTEIQSFLFGLLWAPPPQNPVIHKWSTNSSSSTF